jgi:hypothetical protein
MIFRETLEAELETSGAVAIEMLRGKRELDRDVMLSAWKCLGLLGYTIQNTSLKEQLRDATLREYQRVQAWQVDTWIAPIEWNPEEEEEQCFQFLAWSGVANCMNAICLDVKAYAYFANNYREWSVQVTPSTRKLISAIRQELGLSILHPFFR